MPFRPRTAANSVDEARHVERRVRLVLRLDLAMNRRHRPVLPRHRRRRSATGWSPDSKGREPTRRPALRQSTSASGQPTAASRALTRATSLSDGSSRRRAPICSPTALLGGAVGVQQDDEVGDLVDLVLGELAAQQGEQRDVVVLGHAHGIAGTEPVGDAADGVRPDHHFARRWSGHPGRRRRRRARSRRSRRRCGTLDVTRLGRPRRTLSPRGRRPQGSSCRARG